MRLRCLYVFITSLVLAVASDVFRHRLGISSQGQRRLGQPASLRALAKQPPASGVLHGARHYAKSRPVLAQTKPRMLNAPADRSLDTSTTLSPIEYAEDMTTSEHASTTASTTPGVTAVEEIFDDTLDAPSPSPSPSPSPRHRPPPSRPSGTNDEDDSLSREQEAAVDKRVKNQVKEEVHKMEDDIEERVKDDMEEELRREKEEIRRQVDEELRSVKKDAKEDIEKEVKEDLADEGIGHEERVSRAGEVALDMKWQTFLLIIGIFAMLVFACSAFCYCFPSFGDGLNEDAEDRSVPGSARDLQSEYLKHLMWKPIVWSSILCPFGLICYWFEFWGGWIIFLINLCALVPMTYLMGIATEEFALHFGDKVSALMNASLGNIVELVFVYLTLRDGLTSVCIGTIVGSILGNHLVLLGLSFLFAGADRATLTERDQLQQQNQRRIKWGVDGEYNATNAINQSIMLLVASFCTALPSMFAGAQDVTSHHVVVLSRAMSIFILIAYLAMLVYITSQTERKPIAAKPKLSALVSGLLLAGTALVTILNCEVLVKLMEPFCSQTGLSQVFVGVVVLPLVGDLAHGSAVYVAMKGNMDLAVDICFMSAIQVALLVMPIAVFMGYMMGIEFSLNFRSLHSVSLMGSAIITFAVTVDGKSNWLRGYVLLSTFGFIASMVFFMPDPSGHTLMG